MNARLEELLGQQSKIEHQMTSIGRSLAGLTVASDEANKVNSMIENTSTLAENVSGKVRRLDEARVNTIFLCEMTKNPTYSIFVPETGFRMSAKSS